MIYKRGQFSLDKYKYIDKNGKEYGDKVEGTKLEDETVIRFSSKSFSEFVSEKAGAKEEDMKFKWMKTQTSLSIDDNTIDNLEDLVFFPNLTSLSINQVSTELSNLNGIENCKKLTNIFIGSGKITDFYALSKLEELATFTTTIANDSNWDNLIDSLKDVTTLKDFHSQGGISNMKRVEELEGLETLVITRHKITKIEGIENLIYLKTLSLAEGNISLIEKLEKLTNLTDLDLARNKISQINGLENLINLQSLNLDGDQITKINGLSYLTNLKTLRLQGNDIKDVLPLASNKKLTYLDLRKNANIKVNNYTEDEKIKLLEIEKIMTERNGTIQIDIDKLSLFNGYKTLDLSNQNLTDLSILNRTNRINRSEFK